MFVEPKDRYLQLLLYLYPLQSKADSPSQHGLETQSVFDEDLQKKIEENERLHIQVSSRVVFILVCHCSVNAVNVLVRPCM